MAELGTVGYTVGLVNQTGPMETPDIVKVAELEVKHPEYTELLPTWQKIQELREGAPTLERLKYKYLPKRPGEENEIYNLRLQKFSYTPVMSTAIRDFVAKLVAAPIHLSGLDDKDPFWVDFLSSIDGDRQDQSLFLSALFHSLVYFGRAFVGVDGTPGKPARSLLESKVIPPRALVYEPLTVINWGPWGAVTRTLDVQGTPFGKPKTIATWVYWLEDRTVVYSAEVALDSKGEIGAVIAEGRRLTAGAAVVNKQSDFAHGLGKPAIVDLRVADHLWIGAHVYLKQIQHMVIENAWTDTGSIAGMVQRVFTPSPPVVNDDPRFTKQQPDYEDLKSGNPYILVGNGFEFAESNGSAIESLTTQLQTIEKQIKDLVSMGFATGNRNVAQSGLSKQIDQSMLEDNMRTYGKIGSWLYQEVLKMVVKIAKRTEDTPRVSGLDQYSTDTLDEMITATESLLIASDFIPDEAFKQWFLKLSNLMIGSMDPETREIIDEEIEEIFSGAYVDPAADPLMDPAMMEDPALLA